jgi:bifunctional non-homologous end joining protein LigD
MSADTLRLNSRQIELSNQQKLFFPDSGITKGDLIDYYRRIADWMLPHLSERPLTLQRFPDGIEGHGFYQKDAPDNFPDWIKRQDLEKSGGTVSHVVCNDPATLVYLANQGSITLHTWLSKIDEPRRPDRMIFDLDPSGAEIEEVRFAVRRMRETLDELGLESFLMTTGSQGFHVVVPLLPELDFDEVREFARNTALLLAGSEPARLTVEQRKAPRSGRVFLDYFRNGYAQTAVAPYAVRAIEGAPVATPVDWQELDRNLTPRKYHIGNLFRRLAQKHDPWRSIAKRQQSLTKARRNLDARMERDRRA